MSTMRKLKRDIARSRLEDAGYDRINQRMSMTVQGRKKGMHSEEAIHRGAKNSRKRRAFMTKMRRLDPPVWRRVIEGDLAKKAEQASAKAAFNRKIKDEAHKMKKRQKPSGRRVLRAAQNNAANE